MLKVTVGVLSVPLFTIILLKSAVPDPVRSTSVVPVKVIFTTAVALPRKSILPLLVIEPVVFNLWLAVPVVETSKEAPVAIVVPPDTAKIVLLVLLLLFNNKVPELTSKSPFTVMVLAAAVLFNTLPVKPTPLTVRSL